MKFFMRRNQFGKIFSIQRSTTVLVRNSTPYAVSSIGLLQLSPIEASQHFIHLSNTSPLPIYFGNQVFPSPCIASS